jgi:DNA-binding response OmpR family regulator
MITLLCIDDTPEVQIMVRRTFANSAKVVSAETLSDGYLQLSQNNIDLILLDLNLPDGDGLQLFNKIHSEEKYENIPIIILTSKGQIQDKIMGFHLGAEDYIVKPFDPAELKIRVETRVNRYQVSKLNESIVHVGNLIINQFEQRVSINSGSSAQDIDLTTTEFRILSYLAKHKDHVVTREQIISATWKHGYSISDRTIDSHISRIRKKIQKSEFNISAIQGVGYKFCLQK